MTDGSECARSPVQSAERRRLHVADPGNVGCRRLGNCGSGGPGSRLQPPDIRLGCCSLGVAGRRSACGDRGRARRPDAVTRTYSGSRTADPWARHRVSASNDVNSIAACDLSFCHLGLGACADTPVTAAERGGSRRLRIARGGLIEGPSIATGLLLRGNGNPPAHTSESTLQADSTATSALAMICAGE